MIPYIPAEKLTFKVFGLLPIQPFGILVGIALIVGYHLSRRRARLTGLDENHVSDAAVWGAFGGFIVGHLVSVIGYFPERLQKDPISALLALVKVWEGLSSFGGVMGGIIGVWLYTRKFGLPRLEYVDALVFGTVPGWIFGRMGCAVVHDHPGARSDFFLAVAFPGGGRHDLGLYEMLFLMVLSLLLYAVKNVRPFHGFHAAYVLMLYTPVRFCFDYLRIQPPDYLPGFDADKRYLGLTPAQYFSLALFGFALFLVFNGLSMKRRGYAPGLQPPGEGPPWKKQEKETGSSVKKKRRAMAK